MNNFSSSSRKFLLFCISVSAIIRANAEYSVSGTVLSSVDGEACPGATYKIFNSTDTVYPLIFNVTDIDGKFNGKISNTGKYILQVDYVGLKKRNI